MDFPTVVASTALALVLYFAIRRWFLQGRPAPPGSRLPPGPPGWPLVGHPQFIRENFHSKQAKKWASQYGPVFRIKAGSTDMVILNDFRSIKKFLTRKEMLCRPHNWIFRAKVYEGIGQLNGQQWVDNRRFCFHTLRELGYGKTSMEQHVKDECRCLVETIAEANGVPIAIQDYVFPSTSNNIMALVFGRRYPSDHPDRCRLDQLLSEYFKTLHAGAIVEFLPSILRRIVAKLPSTRRNALGSMMVKFVEYTIDQVEKHKSTLDDDINRDFIDGYLKKIREHENDVDSNFLPRLLVGNVVNLFFGGSNTVATAIHWHMLNFANNADTLQARVQREIDEVVGRERQPTWEDRNQMPFTMACIREMHRWKPSSLSSVPRGTSEDVVVDGYFIPKGTTIFPNIWAVHHDPNLWKEPSKFDPSRFLSDNGTLIHPKPEYLMPFSIGKRMCPGEVLAAVEIFLYITCILQKYRIVPEHGNIPELDDEIPLAHLNHYKLVFNQR
ncbi:cytochrome P450 2C28-like [Haemaphysalis longicornis]